jgi:hypothetical protein
MNDRRAQTLRCLMDEFGGLATSELKKKYNLGEDWDPELWPEWEDMMVRLYKGRHQLDGVQGRFPRGRIALSLFNTTPSLQDHQLKRILDKLEEQEEDDPPLRAAYRSQSGT